MLETARVLVAFILGIALPLAFQRWDLRRLTPRQREGAWNSASWGSALYAFGPFSMIGWLWVTRHEWSRWREGSWAFLAFRSTALLALGALAAAAVIAVITGVDALIGLAAGE